MTDHLPPEMAAFSAFLDAQPAPVQQAFQYCLALLLVEDGKAELVETVPGESGPLCTFRTVAGDVFSLARPALTAAQEADLIVQIREILDDESG